ncbi:MAG: MFS transporter [Firmicutes bacterium]|jgi:ACDE family multidrug resistance protein|nr:MFS transporter [Bacillota bacterium]
MVLGNSMLIPVFPQMKKAMDLTQFQVGLIVTFFSVPAGILIPLAGFLSDRLGRKPIMVPALFIYGLGGLICGFATLFLERPYPLLLVGRVVQGAGAGGTYQLAMALTGDTFQSDERTKALGLLEASNGLGKVLSPILGSLIALISWQTPFFVYGILAFPIALGVWFFVPEKEDNRSRDTLYQYWLKLKDVLQEKAKLLFSSYFVGMTALFLLFGVLSYVSDILESKYGFFGLKKGFILAIPVFSMALTSYLSGLYLSDKQNLWKPIIIGGMVGTAVSLAPLAWIESLVPYLGLLFLAGISIGIILPPINSLITGATSTDRRGMITCLYGTVRFFGVAIGPPTFGLALEAEKAFLFLGSAVVALTAALVALVFISLPTADFSTR